MRTSLLLIILSLLISPISWGASVKQYKRQYAHLPCDTYVQMMSDIQSKYDVSSKHQQKKMRKKSEAIAQLREKKKCSRAYYH